MTGPDILPRWTRRPRRPSAVVVVSTVVGLLIVALLAGSPAQANSEAQSVAEQDVGLAVTAANAGVSPVEVALFGEPVSSSPAVTVNGESVSAQLSTARSLGRPTEIMFVVDVDDRMVGSGALAGAIRAIEAAAVNFDESVEVGVVEAGATAVLTARLSNEHSEAVGDLRTAETAEGSAVLDGVLRAGGVFSETPGVIRTIVVVSGGSELTSTTSPETIRSFLTQRGIQLVVVAPDPSLAPLAGQTGGTVLPAELTPASYAAQVDAAIDLAVDRLLVTFPSQVGPGDRAEVAIGLGDQAVSLSYPGGLLTTNPFQLQPVEIGPIQDPGLAGTSMALYGSILLAFLAVAAAVWVMGSLYAGSQNNLESVLARYVAQGEEVPQEEVQEALVQTALMRRAVDLTENLAERQGGLDKVERMLERANLPIRPGEGLFFLFAAVVVAFAAVFFLSQSLLFAVVVALLVIAGAYYGLQIAASRRLKQFEGQVPDALQLLAGTLRAGYSLPQGLDSVSNEMADPMGVELRRAITETQLGRELDEALAGMADRLQSEDFAWVVMAIGIQREVGGNLAEVLLSVADTMVQRERLHREVSALTAEGRISAIILSIMPPGLGAVMFVVNREYIMTLFNGGLGLILLAFATIGTVVGLLWMKKLVDIDV